MGCTLEISHMERTAHQITQHNRFIPNSTHPNFALQKLLLCWKRYMKFRTPNLKNEKFIKDVIKINQ